MESYRRDSGVRVDGVGRVRPPPNLSAAGETQPARVRLWERAFFSIIAVGGTLRAVHRFANALSGRRVLDAELELPRDV